MTIAYWSWKKFMRRRIQFAYDGDCVKKLRWHASKGRRTFNWRTIAGGSSRQFMKRRRTCCFQHLGNSLYLQGD